MVRAFAFQKKDITGANDNSWYSYFDTRFTIAGCIIMIVVIPSGDIIEFICKYKSFLSVSSESELQENIKLRRINKH